MDDNMERTSLTIYINRETGETEIRDDNAIFDKKESRYLTTKQTRWVIRNLIKTLKKRVA